MEKFSDTLEAFTSTIENPEIQDSLNLLQLYIPDDIKILDWGFGKIAIPIDVNIDLPNLGNFQNLDIREKEPIIIVLDLLNYPLSAPRVYTDRVDFPKNNLAHLYVATNGRPPAFCYVRGNADEWYANKRINDLVIRICNWLRDAATGELTENGNQFEPLRLEGYSGSIIYDYDSLLSVIENSALIKFEDNFGIALFERTGESLDKPYNFIRFLTTENAHNTAKEVELERKKTDNDITKKNYHFGFILWNDQNYCSSAFDVNIPDSWERFITFCKFYNIKHEAFEKFVSDNSEINYYKFFPVIIGIRRPKQLIGYSSNIEFICLQFNITETDIQEKKIVNNFQIKMLKHNQPLTQNLADRISGSNSATKERCLIFGCGAIGSKIIFHLARSGNTNLTLIDPDNISPHNLTRHGLFADSIGDNKANAIKEKIKDFYPLENLMIISGSSFKEGLIEKKETFKNYKWILDFTASNAFFNKLVTLESISNCNIVSASVSNFGTLGIMYNEGELRNPRLDDLQIYLYSLSADFGYIKDWLTNEKNATDSSNLLIPIGVGCNSETTILADDKISSHSAYFTGVLKKEMTLKSKKGKIYLNHIKDEEDYMIETRILEVEPFLIIPATNDKKWSIRIKFEIKKELEEAFRNSGKYETGGVLLGVCNYKTKTIHVVNILFAPSDSEASSVIFVRGREGLAEKIAEIEKKSGGQIGYIGEWHTHPDGPNILSVQDMVSVEKHKEECLTLNPPLPVFVTIITPDGLFPYVF